MPLEHQHGTVFLRGKRRKMWYGKYRVWQRVPGTDSFVTKQRTKRIGPKSELTRFEAEERLRQMIAADNATSPSVPADVAPKQLTLAWFVVNRHLPMMACRATTKGKTQYEIGRYLLRQFGDRLLKEIGLFELQTHLNTLAQNFSDSVARHAYVNLRSIFNNAVELDFLAKSPAKRLHMPDTRTPDKTTLPAETIMQLLNATEDPMDRCVLSIGIFCALRTAEVFGLTWGCYEGDHLAIRSTAYEGKMQEHKLKNAESRALVPIPSLIQPIIATWHAAASDISHDALMFSTTGKRTRKGQRVPFDSTNFMERRIHPVADRLGIPRRLVTFQVMRRTVGTDLQSHGTLKDAQAVLRHKSSVTTANVYMQPISEGVKAALNARAAAVFASAKPKGRKKTTSPSHTKLNRNP